MHSLRVRITGFFFLTTLVVVTGLSLVVNYQVSEHFTAYLAMSSMHGMMNQGNMAAIMGVPEHQFLVSLKRSLWLAALAMLVMGATISYYLARSIALPVLELNQAVRAVAMGNLETTVQVRYQDEVGQLALAFNAMTARLNTSIMLRQRFLAGVVHELRTPLTILKANLEGILDGVIVPDQPQMDSLIEEVDRLTTMVGELRELSLLEAGQITPRWSELDVQFLLQQVVQKIMPLIEQKRLQLAHTTVGIPLPLEADADMVRQMVYNLLMNAIRYTQGGGSITVSAVPEGNVVRLQVTDTGIGIAAEEQEHIFDYFYRVDQSRTKQSGGTGLGLALVKQMALAHGGTIQVESTLGQGSAFILKLPLYSHRKSTISP
jgi:signal transduction histidine kinase